MTERANEILSCPVRRGYYTYIPKGLSCMFFPDGQVFYTLSFAAFQAQAYGERGIGDIAGESQRDEAGSSDPYKPGTEFPADG